MSASSNNEAVLPSSIESNEDQIEYSNLQIKKWMIERGKIQTLLKNEEGEWGCGD